MLTWCSTEIKASVISFNEPAHLKNGLMYTSKSDPPRFRNELYRSFKTQYAHPYSESVIDAWENFYDAEETLLNLSDFFQKK